MGKGWNKSPTEPRPVLSQTSIYITIGGTSTNWRIYYRRQSILSKLHIYYIPGYSLYLRIIHESIIIMWTSTSHNRPCNFFLLKFQLLYGPHNMDLFYYYGIWPSNKLLYITWPYPYIYLGLFPCTSGIQIFGCVFGNLIIIIILVC